ncbi:unnamed protein product, partial [Rotaria socialis]
INQYAILNRYLDIHRCCNNYNYDNAASLFDNDDLPEELNENMADTQKRATYKSIQTFNNTLPFLSYSINSDMHA